IDQICFFDIGLNDSIAPANTLLGDFVVCPGDPRTTGWVQLGVTGLDGLENELGIAAFSQSAGQTGGAEWMYAQGERFAPPSNEDDCSDGVDADLDGLTDCEDPDCAGSPDCAEGSCTDGIDGDGDGFTDCEDSECDADPACTEINCSDGLDSDGDGLTDCADPDCIVSPQCFESDCDDGIDSDGDGLTDCADPDCSTEPACILGVSADDGDGNNCTILSIAGSGASTTTAANALIMLIPLLAVGLRTLIRRREED
ncbi:MAG: hypothetical protein V3U74_05955, partial [Thermodesulfobacteriota bacterium]